MYLKMATAHTERGKKMEWIVEAETIEDLVDGPMMISKKIVRCKDCKWWVPARCAGEPKAGRCKDKCASERSDGFCSHGERKTAESE